MNFGKLWFPVVMCIFFQRGPCQFENYCRCRVVCQPKRRVRESISWRSASHSHRTLCLSNLIYVNEAHYDLFFTSLSHWTDLSVCIYLNRLDHLMNLSFKLSNCATIPYSLRGVETLSHFLVRAEMSRKKNSIHSRYLIQMNVRTILIQHNKILSQEHHNTQISHW